ncbi:MAG: NAD(P)/FAD-dependent oxidoreductase [Ruminococcus sp.]|jgi:NADPH-dependent 2,4-dienoyl-CoA reductase/sulfur reductase-like enzyme
MKVIHKQVIIIGGGPGGLAAAAELKRKGINDLLILEREHWLGGILRQCIHDGFGLTRFGETLSGPEYAQRFIDQINDLGIEAATDTTVIGLSQDRIVTAVSRNGLMQYQADAVILTMGCRERTRGALSIPGERPSGVFTAGVAQAYINLKNKMVGHHAVILGSGDIGMIMARRLTLEGAKVEAVFEIQPYASGLPRNIEQCLNDYGIPLYLNHTVTKIKGANRLEAVEVSQVDEHLQPVPGTEKEYVCDTLILSVGLIPENELSLMAGVQLDPRTKGAVVDEGYQTNVPGIFAAGNVLHVHDLVDFVSLEAERLAESVAAFLNGRCLSAQIQVETGGLVGYTVPQRITGNQDVTLFFRPRKPTRNCYVEIRQDENCLVRKKYPRLLPAQMESISLPASKLSSYSNVKVVTSFE